MTHPSANRQLDISPEALVLLGEAQHSPSLVFLSGFHAIKHAMRFGANLSFIATSDPEKSLSLCTKLAPDILDSFSQKLCIVTQAQMKHIHPNRLHWTEVWAVAQRPTVDIEALFREQRTEPLIVLEDPKNLGNLGACIRTSAALGASGFVVLGESDPWSPRVIQGASGLQFALPVGRMSTIPPYSGTLMVCDPDGEDVSTTSIPQGVIMLFGTEREGVTDSFLADQKVRIPMHEGVSSLNLSVSVGIALTYASLSAKK